jgi:putative transposase
VGYEMGLNLTLNLKPMPHSYSKLWVHAIWGTKYRQPLIEPSIEQEVFNFLSNQLREQGCPVRIINGMPDHVHCLFLLNRQLSISDLIKQVKGASSFFINQKKLTSQKFAWQTGYAAFSVSTSVLPQAYQYVKRQKQHHLTKNFSQEYEAFLRLYGYDLEE